MENLVQSESQPVAIVETATPAPKLQTDIVLASIGMIASIGDIILGYAEEVAIDRYYQFGVHPTPFIEEKIANEIINLVKMYLNDMNPQGHQLTEEHSKSYFAPSCK